MANVLVFIELDGDRPGPGALEALGEGRRLASDLGATLYAVVACAAPPSYGADDLLSTLSRGGADKVALITAPELDAPLLHATHGASLEAVCARVPPALLLFASTPGARDLAPRLAAHLGAIFLAEPQVEHDADGQVLFRRVLRHTGVERRLAADELERPAVLTLAAGQAAPALGEEEAEVILIPPPPDVSPPRVVEVAREPDAGRALETARVVVCAGAGVATADGMALARALADALGAELAATATACARGLAPPALVVGVTGRRVAPRLYVSLGASGSTEHLQGVAPGAAIVAVNSDPDAPVFRAARFGVVGDLRRVVPEMIEGLRARRR